MVTLTHTIYRHEALLYRSVREFVDVAAPFVREGLRCGQPVMVAVAGARLDALRGALGPDAVAVNFADMAEIGRNPARIIPAWLDFVSRHEGKPLRGIGEPIWSGRSDTEIEECQLHEVLLNRAVRPDVPLWLICPYDVSALEPAVLQEAHRSHPVIVESDQYRGSTTYGGAYHAQALFNRPLTEPAVETVELTLTIWDVSRLQEFIAAAADQGGVEPECARALSWSVRQLATDSIRIGGAARLRYWNSSGLFVVEISDHGVVNDPLIGRRLIADQEPRRRSIHHANQTADLVQVRSNPSGTVVRVHTRSSR